VRLELEITTCCGHLPKDNPVTVVGVTLALNRAAHNALKAWFPVHSRLLVAKFQHRFGTLSIVVAYDPTNDASDIVKDEFYEMLEQAMQPTNCSVMSR